MIFIRKFHEASAETFSGYYPNPGPMWNRRIISSYKSSSSCSSCFFLSRSSLYISNHFKYILLLLSSSNSGPDIINTYRGKISVTRKSQSPCHLFFSWEIDFGALKKEWLIKRSLTMLSNLTRLWSPETLLHLPCHQGLNPCGRTRRCSRIFLCCCSRFDRSRRRQL